MPIIGATLNLNLQLFDGATNKFVRATLRDASGASLGSPVAMPHVGLGLYSDDSQVMPNTAEVTATYKVFDDAGFTTPSADHSDALDVFALTEATALVSNVDLELVAVIESDNIITASLEDC